MLVSLVILSLRLSGLPLAAAAGARLSGFGQQPTLRRTQRPITKHTAHFHLHERYRLQRIKYSHKITLQKNLASEYYDLNDPFIDDSELAVDERTYFAQTKQQGFYVSSGEVALLKDKTPKKPKSKRPILPPLEPIAGPSNFPHAHAHSHNVHTQLAGPAKKDKDKEKEKKDAGPAVVDGVPKEMIITLLSDADEEKGGKRKSVGAAEANGNGKKKRKVVEIQPFHPELEIAIKELKDAAAKESWETKGKFPPAIKPILAKVALKAIRLNEYDDNFFNLMPQIFPYNRFTMSKLIKRTVFNDHTALLTQRQDELLVELKNMADEGFERAREDWEKNVAVWERKQEKTKPDGGEASLEGTPAAPDDAGPMDVDGDGAAHESGTGSATGKDGKDGKEAHAPTRKYRMTEAMKGVIWNLVCLSNECCRIENEKNSLEGSTTQVSEQGLRKVLYQKIVAAFPDGWMSSGQISREVSVMKKKFEKEMDLDS
ncbi:hypothetical protein DENSPDRAFT_842833 [Dentipellis sp. KUC8613]|nr:hypothetical protein DENSPDRAFT_842833 [Dentipellis sp. KUC8613]